MIDNRVKIPQIIALILQGLALVLSILSVISQRSIASALSSLQFSGPAIVPLPVYITGIGFAIQLVFLFVTSGYKGNRRRLIAGIIAAIYCLVSISSQWLNLLTNILIARQGAERLAVAGLLTSAISNSAGPFLTVSSALFFIALGRYGICKSFDTEMYGDQYYPGAQ